MKKRVALGSKVINTVILYSLTVILVALLPTVAYGDWRSTGPFGGDAEIIRTVPEAPGLVVAGTHNGLLFTSTDGGAFWKHLPFDGQFSGTLHALEIDPRSASTWYVGMESDRAWTSGVYKTVDSGASWTLLPEIKGQAVWSLAIWSGNPDVVAAGTADGVYRSSDAGNSWTKISSPDNQELRPVVSLAFDPKSSDIIYAGTTHLPWRTMDGGASWESIHTGMLDDSDVFSIQVDFHNPEQVYASACSGLYHSSDSATHWNKLQTPVGTFRTWFVALDPHHEHYIFAGTTGGLLKSENGGLTWRQVTSQAVRSIAFDVQNPDRIYFASLTAGIMVSTDDGKTARESNAGFTNRNFAVLTGGKGALYSSSVFEPGSGGIYRTDNLGLRWQRSASERGQDFRLLTAAPDQPGTLFAAGYHGLFKSSDGGKTWNGKITFLEGVGHLRSLLALPHNVVLAGTDQALYRSTDGIGWKKAAGPGGVINFLERSGDRTVSVLSTQGAFASTDAGVTWRACGEPAPSTIWYGLAFDSDQADAATALAATSTGLFRSTDGCQSWLKATGLPEATVSIVLFHPTRAGEAFATQGGEVFRSTDQGQHWVMIDDAGRGRSWPSSLVILPESPDRLFALFPRRGVLWNTVEVEQGTPAARSEPAVQTAR
jgi:photosystem II stability/assembly factor-like uncharacterized protein